MELAGPRNLEPSALRSFWFHARLSASLMPFEVTDDLVAFFYNKRRTTSVTRTFASRHHQTRSPRSSKSDCLIPVGKARPMST